MKQHNKNTALRGIKGTALPFCVRVQPGEVIGHTQQNIQSAHLVRQASNIYIPHIFSAKYGLPFKWI